VREEQLRAEPSRRRSWAVIAAWASLPALMAALSVGVLLGGGASERSAPVPVQTVGGPAAEGSGLATGPFVVPALPRCPGPAPTPSTSTIPTELGRLPTLTLACLGPGPAVSLNAGRGEPSVVNLWASWCDPCRREMPRLRAAADRLGSGAVLLGVNVKDHREDALRFLTKTGVRYPQVVDAEGEALAGLHLPGIPSTYVLNSSGDVVYRHIGELHDSDVADVEAAVLNAS